MSNIFSFNKYSFEEFCKDFATEKDCLKFLFQAFYSDKPDFHKYAYHDQTARFVNSETGEKINPKINTIFWASRTPLTVWFQVIYLSLSGCGLGYRELMNTYGLTYSKAKRMEHSINKLLATD
jgi:hypothetical protein